MNRIPNGASVILTCSVAQKRFSFSRNGGDGAPPLPRLNSSPFSSQIRTPELGFPLPIWSTVSPKREIEIEIPANEFPLEVNVQTYVKKKCKPTAFEQTENLKPKS